MPEALGASGELTPVDVPLTPRLLRVEILIVLAVGLGPAIITAVVLLSRYLIGGASAVVIITRLPGHPWVDAMLQIALSVAGALVVLLVAYVLLRSGESLRDIGLTRDRLVRDLGVAIGLTVLLLVSAGALGAAFRGIGIHGISVHSKAMERWAYEPAWIVDSIRTALVEELIVCGYFIHRLRQLGWSDPKALAASMAVRASYHVYGGVLLVVFTILFGYIMGRVYQRTKRLTAIIATHALYDATLFTIAVAVNVHRHG